MIAGRPTGAALDSGISKQWKIDIEIAGETVGLAGNYAHRDDSGRSARIISHNSVGRRRETGVGIAFNERVIDQKR